MLKYFQKKKKNFFVKPTYTTVFDKSRKIVVLLNLIHPIIIKLDLNGKQILNHNIGTINLAFSIPEVLRIIRKSIDRTDVKF